MVELRAYQVTLDAVGARFVSGRGTSQGPPAPELARSAVVARDTAQLPDLAYRWIYGHWQSFGAGPSNDAQRHGEADAGGSLRPH